MPATHLVLVRHGESTGNAERRITGWLDVPLSEKGAAQARAAGRALRAQAPFDAVYASDLSRARDTAIHLVGELGFPAEAIKIRPELRERHPGILAGLGFDEAKEKHPELWAALLRREWDFVAPEGESNDQVSERLQRVLAEALRAHEGGKVIFVSHGVALAQLLRIVLGIPPGVFPRQIAFTTENAALHRLLRREDESWLVLALNETAHLASL